jgi:hypothetical protein
MFIVSARPAPSGAAPDEPGRTIVDLPEFGIRRAFQISTA